MFWTQWVYLLVLIKFIYNVSVNLKIFYILGSNLQPAGELSSYIVMQTIRNAWVQHVYI